KAYRQHKSLPPQVSLPDSQKTRTVSRDGTVEDDVRREMTAEEREWWSNPYLRMLSTPLRRCAVSSRYLPTGMSSLPPHAHFMIRLSPKRLPSALTGPKRRYTLVPDGLQHPKFKGVDSSHRGCSISPVVVPPCKNMTREVPHLQLTPSTKRRCYRRMSSASSCLPRCRTISVTCALAYSARTGAFGSAPAGSPSRSRGIPLLRRLTRKEFSAIRAGKPLEDQDAVVVLVVPPLNRDPVTKTRQCPMHRLFLPNCRPWKYNRLHTLYHCPLCAMSLQRRTTKVCQTLSHL
ncbi:hypothetical protein BJV77DRAFT_1135244, partial [Russula vinacea]